MPRHARSLTSKTSLSSVFAPHDFHQTSPRVAIGILHFMATRFQLNHNPPNTIEKIERFKACDYQGNAILLCNRWILPVAHHAAHVPGEQKTLYRFQVIAKWFPPPAAQERAKQVSRNSEPPPFRKVNASSRWPAPPSQNQLRKKTILRSGLFAASSTASSGE